ncbi:hypothetical protein ACQP3F_32510, partial [Escherichia coli]
ATILLDFSFPNKSLERVLGKDLLSLEWSRISSGKLSLQNGAEKQWIPLLGNSLKVACQKRHFAGAGEGCYISAGISLLSKLGPQ